MKEGKWEIIRNQKAIVRDRDQKDNNKQEFGTLGILFWKYCGFPWCKGPMISWIPSGIDIIYLAETWEHEESKVPNIDRFILYSTCNKKSSRRGVGGIACYIRTNISPHIHLHKKDPLNQFIWVDISKYQC